MLLHRARWDDRDSDLTILGCTLWSSIPEEAYGVVEAKVGDFRKIKHWTPPQHTATHEEEVAWLSKEVAHARAGASKRRILIATHHAPCIEGTSRPDQISNPWTPAFSTDLLDQETWEGVKAWVFGHTHYSTKFVRNGIKLVSNQRGYVLPSSERQPRGRGVTKEGREFDAALVVAL